MTNLLQTPENLPVPIDDGATDHLLGMEMPDIFLETTTDEKINFSTIKKAVIFVYPMTGRPDTPLPEHWDEIPGARGCTPQACSFRDKMDEFSKNDVKVFGLSVQSSEYQKEASNRIHLNYPLVSDENFLLQKSLNLPTFTVKNLTLLKRVTLVVEHGKITKVFYPVFPTNKNVDEVLKLFS